MTDTTVTINTEKCERINALLSDKSFCEKLSQVKDSGAMKKLFAENDYIFDNDEEFEAVVDALIDVCENYNGVTKRIN